MWRRSAQRTAAAVVAATLAVLPLPSAHAAAPEDLPPELHGMYDMLGKPAPAFALESPAGTPVTLEELRKGDRVLVVQLWASWCQPCHIEALILKQMYQQFSRDDLQIVGLHANDPSAELIPELRARLGMNYPVAVATDAVWEAYGGTPLLPTSLILGRDGRVRRVELGVKWVDEVEATLRTLTSETVEQAAAATISASDFGWGNAGGVPADGAGL